MLDSRLPPQDKHAEAATIGAILRDNQAYDDVRPIVSPDDFYFDAHRRVYAVVAEALDAGKPVDLILLHDRLKAAGDLENVGGASYLADLWDATPTAANATYHARVVREKSIRRKLVHLCGEITRDAYDGEEPAEQLVARFESAVFKVGDGAEEGDPVRLGHAVDEVFADLDALHTGHAPRHVPTGLEGLDNVIGGLHPERLIIVAARPSVGKSALGLAFAVNAARQGVGALVVSLEMGAKEWAARALAGACDVPLNMITGSSPIDTHGAARLSAGSGACRVPVWIDDRSGHTIDTIAAVARRAVRKHRVGLIVVDYLGLIEHGGNKSDTLATRVGNTTRKLKHLARSLKVPVVCLAQLNRDVEKRGDGRPLLSDLRDSGEIEQHADDVLMLWPQETPQFDGAPAPIQEIRVCVEKQRNGPKSIVSLNYVRRFVRFETPRDTIL